VGGNTRRALTIDETSVQLAWSNGAPSCNGAGHAKRTRIPTQPRHVVWFSWRLRSYAVHGLGEFSPKTAQRQIGTPAQKINWPPMIMDWYKLPSTEFPVFFPVKNRNSLVETLPYPLLKSDALWCFDSIGPAASASSPGKCQASQIDLV